MSDFESFETPDDKWEANTDEEGWLIVRCVSKSPDRPDDAVSYPPEVLAWLASVTKKAAT